jgi:inorganic pyrophosphatase
MPNYVQDIPYKTPDGQYQAVIEIPAGTLEKWQTDATTGVFYHDVKDGKPRVINFLPYPFNYGFIPQTLLSKEQGGDGDPMDVLVLSSTRQRGSVCPVRIIGALKLMERGENDTKMLALETGEGPFQNVSDINELLLHYPGAVEILRLWFEGYKGPGSFLFGGYATRQEAAALIELAHNQWKKQG